MSGERDRPGPRTAPSCSTGRNNSPRPSTPSASTSVSSPSSPMRGSPWRHPARVGHIRPDACPIGQFRPRAVPPSRRGRHATARRTAPVPGFGLCLPGEQTPESLRRLPQGGTPRRTRGVGRGHRGLPHRQEDHGRRVLARPVVALVPTGRDGGRLLDLRDAGPSTSIAPSADA